MDYCIQGQGHREGSICQWMFVWMVSSELQNSLLLNLVWWSSMLSQGVMQREKKVFCLQGQGHSKGLYDQNMTLSAISSELLIPWQPNLVWWYDIISQSVLWEKLITAFKIKVAVKGQNVSVCPDDTLYTAKHIVTKLGIVMHHHEPECMQKDWLAIFKVKVTQGFIWSKYEFLLHRLNCWSFCYHTWLDSTLS